MCLMWVWILFCVRFIAIVKATILPQILKINYSKLTLKLWTHCEPTSITKKISVTHSLKTVQSIHIWIIYFPCPLFFTSHLPCFCCHVVSTLDATQAALQIIWTLCQYVINRTSQQFTVGICRAASSVDIITDYNMFYCILLRAPHRSRPV